MRPEVLSNEGFRMDGRRPNELRRISHSVGVLPQADGSSLFEIGNTKVIAAVYGPRESRLRALDRATLLVDFTQTSFSERRSRKTDRKNLEIQVQIRETLESAVMTFLYPRSQINVFLQVMQSDGGLLQACINAATLALINAGIGMKDYIVACTVGDFNGIPLLDLNRGEISVRVPEITVALLPKTEEIVFIMMESRLSADRLENTLKLAFQGCHSIHKILNDFLLSEVK